MTDLHIVDQSRKTAQARVPPWALRIAGTIIWRTSGDLLVVTTGDTPTAGADGMITTGDLFGTGVGVVVNEGSGQGGGSPQAGAAATHNVANATAFASTSTITAALRERSGDLAHLMASPLAVPILEILVRSEHSDVSSPLLKLVTLFLVSSVTISSGSRMTHQRGDDGQIANDSGRSVQRQRN